jgi:hypothetical protein
MNPSRSSLGDTCRIFGTDCLGPLLMELGMSRARTPVRTSCGRRLMTLRVRNIPMVLGLRVLGSFALSPAGCGTNSDNQGGAGRGLNSGGSNAPTDTGGSAGGQGGSNAPIGTGGVTGGDAGSGTGGEVKTGYACSGGGGELGTGTMEPRSCPPYAASGPYCIAGVCGCVYNWVTGCLCADNTVSPCEPLDPTCTAATAGGTANFTTGTTNPNRNLSCYCDRYGYWWCY